MKVLVLGHCGSMGRRRVRCLKRLGYKKIFGYDTGDYYLPEFKDDSVTRIDNYEKFKGDAVIISTPPESHIEYIRYFSNKGMHVFCEASVIPEDREHYAGFSKEKIIFPSSTIKFKDSISFIKNNLNLIGDIYSYDYRCAGNLRTWHPWQDISEYYVSDPETGAGREITAFELGWLNYIFGERSYIEGSFVTGLSEISESTGIDDIYTFIISHEVDGVKTVGSCTVDVFSHKNYRVLRIIGSEGNIEFDWSNNFVRLYDKSGSIIKEFAEDQNEHHSDYSEFSTEKMYDTELKNFFESMSNPSLAICTLKSDHKVLSLLEEIEENRF